MTKQLSVVSCQSSVAGTGVTLRPQRTTDYGLRTARLRRAVTLVELLITMFIITLLAGLVLGVAAVAGETAREAATKTTVQKLHKLMMEHYDTYKTRRVQVRQQVIDEINGQNKSATQKGRERALARLYALRELMIMEIPDRWTDITLLSPDPDSQNRYPFYLDVSRSMSGRTDLSAVYLRRLQQIQSTVTEENQGAECLYLIITLATGDGEARSLFGESSIDDTDEDGAYEFVDSWGNPINFLRWAPGFDSVVQIDANTLDNPPNGTAEEAWEAAASGDHDPFDLYRVQSTWSSGGERPAYRLVPLIYSAGRDDEYGIHRAESYKDALRGITDVDIDVDVDGFPARSPYTQVTDGSIQIYLGTATGDGSSTDNVHNHLLGRK